jgi:hypothetical protein
MALIPIAFIANDVDFDKEPGLGKKFGLKREVGLKL